MAGSSEGEEENYWPGFVDALTTMVMVLTFVMMVLGIVVFTLSQNVSKNYMAAIDTAVKAPTRDANNVKRDGFRHPAQTLSFFKVTPEKTVLAFAVSTCAMSLHLKSWQNSGFLRR